MTIPGERYVKSGDRYAVKTFALLCDKSTRWLGWRASLFNVSGHRRGNGNEKWLEVKIGS